MGPTEPKRRKLAKMIEEKRKKCAIWISLKTFTPVIKVKKLNLPPGYTGTKVNWEAKNHSPTLIHWREAERIQTKLLRTAKPEASNVHVAEVFKKCVVTPPVVASTIDPRIFDDFLRIKPVIVHPEQETSDQLQLPVDAPNIVPENVNTSDGEQDSDEEPVSPGLQNIVLQNVLNSDGEQESDEDEVRMSTRRQNRRRNVISSDEEQESDEDKVRMSTGQQNRRRNVISSEEEQESEDEEVPVSTGQQDIAPEHLSPSNQEEVSNEEPLSYGPQNNVPENDAVGTNNAEVDADDDLVILFEDFFDHDFYSEIEANDLDLKLVADDILNGRDRELSISPAPHVSPSGDSGFGE